MLLRGATRQAGSENEANVGAVGVCQQRLVSPTYLVAIFGDVLRWSLASLSQRRRCLGCPRFGRMITHEAMLIRVFEYQAANRS